MGGAGSDVALETADIVLMADRLEKNWKKPFASASDPSASSSKTLPWP